MRVDDIPSSQKNYQDRVEIYKKIRERLEADIVFNETREQLDLERISGLASMQGTPLLINYVANIAEAMPEMNYRLANDNLPLLRVVTGKIVNQKRRRQYENGFYKPVSRQMYVPKIDQPLVVYPQLLNVMTTDYYQGDDYNLETKGYFFAFRDKTGDVLGNKTSEVAIGYEFNELYHKYLISKKLNMATNYPMELVDIFDKLKYLMKGNDLKNYANGNAFVMYDQLLSVVDQDTLIEMVTLFEVIYNYLINNNHLIKVINKSQMIIAIERLSEIVDDALLKRRAEEKAIKSTSKRTRYRV